MRNAIKLWTFISVLCVRSSGSSSGDRIPLPAAADAVKGRTSAVCENCNCSIGASLPELRNGSRTFAAPDSPRIPSRPTDISQWTEFPVLPLVFASSESLPEGRCARQARRFLEELANSTLWAVQMFDASTKYPDGIIFGHTKHLGNFDECYNLRAKLPPDEEEVEGRYCLVRLRYGRKTRTPSGPPETYTLDFDPNRSAWDAIDDNGDFRRVKRQSVYMSLCVPASCSAEDVAAGLTDPLNDLADARGIKLEVTVKPSLCQARADLPKSWSTGTRIFSVFVAALLVLVVGSSWYDSCIYSAEEASKENYELQDIFLCFSARRNFRSIMFASGSHPGLDCIHLIRFFFMTGVIFGHRMMQYYGFPMVESVYLEKGYTVPSSMMVFNGPIVVDGFFGLGGLLLAYGLLGELDRTGRFNFLAYITIRFLRLTPLYMLVVFFNVTLLPLAGSGPYWEARIGLDRDNCAKNWWTNLLYINNYVNPEESCIFQSWYLSVDYHLYIFGLLVLWAFWQLPRRLGYTFLAGLIALGIAIPFYVTYTQNIQPMFLGLPFMGEVRKDPYFINYYIKSHMRIGPYMVGILAGAIVYDHKGSTWRLSKAWSRLLFILLAVGLSIWSQSLGAKYFDPNSEHHPLEAAAYAAFHRPAFALGICSIVVLIAIGEGLDFHYNLMTPRWVPPLARLTYGAFLVHNINQSYDIAVTRSARTFSVHNCFWDLVPDLAYTFGLSLLLSIAVEGPIRKIEMFLLTKRSSSRDATERSSVDCCNAGKKSN
ncbi:nose resistant to fluoxetine protein 6-like [Athalia rosae]|uniref:nose resistant to fluoxetine protein 6-like n=1 Tax=Athalia rosae TaxID=37344 RepID=UPI0020337166|nr:nose resistant to fluoxetine protein 6-like [Athalia rosae]